MVKKQLSMLALLAKSDHHLADEERQLIIHLGEAHGFSISEIEKIIEEPGSIQDIHHMNEDQKFECLYSLVQLMKIDDKVYNEEIHYCQELVTKLGYQLQAIMEIYPFVYKNLRIPEEQKQLKKRVRPFLNRGD
ncbi:MAG: TerB family tellurite resistance protein [Bacteroidetes bacterium]|nr:TerB family tellurite resistance protein [Bacteroidota bacterium]